MTRVRSGGVWSGFGAVLAGLSFLPRRTRLATKARTPLQPLRCPRTVPGLTGRAGPSAPETRPGDLLTPTYGRRVGLIDRGMRPVVRPESLSAHPLSSLR